LREWPQIAWTFECVAKPLFVEMRKIDHDAELVAGLDQSLAGIGQARSGVGRRRETERHAVAESVRAAPDDAERAQARRMQHVEHRQFGVDRLDAFNMEHRRDRPLRHRISHVASAAADGERRRSFQPEQDRGHGDGGSERVGARNFGRQGLGIARRRWNRTALGFLDRRRKDREHAASKAALFRARQVDVPTLRSLDEQLLNIRVLRLIEPEQRIVVAVEDGNEVGLGHQGIIRFDWSGGNIPT
jgi:hypothetical protein